MSESPTVVVEQSASASSSAMRLKPKKVLPTDRLPFDRQIQILRAYAIASGVENKPVTNAEVGKLVEMAPDTVALGNTYFADVGLLLKADSGGYTPCAEVLGFDRACQWNADTAGAKLSPLIERSWFGQHLLSRLRLRGTISEEEAIQELADAAGASTSYKKNLKLLIEYMIKALLIERDGLNLKLVRQQVSSSSASVAAAPDGPPARVESTDNPPMVGSPLSAWTEGRVEFSVDLKVNMSEIAGWEPSRIVAFFNGIAQVLAAKKGKDS